MTEVYDHFYEGDKVHELVDDLNELLGTNFETLYDVSKVMKSRLEDFLEEDSDEFEEDWDDDDAPEEKVDSVPLGILDYEILRGENEPE